MTRAKELLDAATPLPWDGRLANAITRPENRALAVYAVNHLPDYLAAVEALERMVAVSDAMSKPEAAYIAPVPDWYEAHKAARAALARLREGEAANVR